MFARSGDLAPWTLRSAGFSVLVRREGEAQVERAFYLEVLAFEAQDRRAARGGFRVAPASLGRTHARRSIVDHTAALLDEKPPDPDGAGAGAVFG